MKVPENKEYCPNSSDFFPDIVKIPRFKPGWSNQACIKPLVSIFGSEKAILL